MTVDISVCIKDNIPKYYENKSKIIQNNIWKEWRNFYSFYRLTKLFLYYL